jgi:drug/metabolite transporter (DMT)-like permease
VNSRSGLVAAVTAIFFWAAGNVMVRLVELAGLQLAFWRIGLAAVVYWIILVASGRKLTVEHLKTSAPAAIAIALQIAVLFTALKATTVANTTVIVALQPIVLLFFGLRRFGERVSALLVALALVALAGVALVVFGSSGAPIWSPRGDFLAVVAMLLFSLYYIFAKTARAEVPALEFQTAVWIIGTVVLLPVAAFDAGGIVIPEWRQWVGVAVLLAIPGSGHFLMNWAHARVKLSVTSMLTLGLPVLSTIGASIFLDEPLGGWQLPGIAIVVAALAAAIRREAVLHLEHTRTAAEFEPEPQA